MEYRVEIWGWEERGSLEKIMLDYEGCLISTRDNAPSMTIIRYWYNEFKRGQTSIFEERPGHPIEVTTEDVINKIHDIVLADRREIREIANIVKISTERKMSYETLGMKKLSAKWMPRLLIVEQKRNRMTTSKHCLDMFKRNPKEFLRFVTVDETWIHHYTPEAKEQSKQWTKSGESAPKKAKTVLSARKIMATVFWDSQGMIFTDLEKGWTITGQYYVMIYWIDSTELKKKRPHLAKKKCSFTIIMHQVIRPQSPWQNWSNYELLSYPYSPFGPLRFLFISKHEKRLEKKAESALHQMRKSSPKEAYFNEFDQSYFLNGIKMLEYGLG
ncbi:PREDICTED: LOW QUALITY PROTEIN: uncharacterized protein LOC108693227 [Atta colombica]|uniref:LOW QUALITY PROTEIN: uncharacterized protein LOC108693227 n=1 Tax=Atta colombica TaxID=520822 RepID=UPI00084BD33D|nr:PREDICTED: LOW QUALITY PROTEIN: uncharacterized protein LOC108693227 [Atta colombica]